MLDTVNHVKNLVVASVERALRERTDRHDRAVVEAIFSFADGHRAATEVLFNCTLSSTPDLIAVRAQSIAAIASILQRAHANATGEGLVSALNEGVLVGGLIRLVGMSLRRGGSPDAELRDATLTWLESYAVARDGRRQDSLSRRSRWEERGAVVGPPFGAEPAAGLGERTVRDARAIRHRLLFATATLAIEKGLRATTVAEIAKHAHVGHRNFHLCFADKYDAFRALFELANRRLLAAAFSAYFSEKGWPQRLWAAGEAYTGLLASSPTLADVAFVEPAAWHPRLMQAQEEVPNAVLLFLYEGYEALAATQDRPSRVALEATAATILEFVYDRCRRAEAQRLPDLLAQALFIALTPFLGLEAAYDFLDKRNCAISA